MELLTLTLLLCLVALVSARHVLRWVKMRGFPGPTSYQVISNLMEVIHPLEHTLDYMEELFQQFPGLFAFWLGPLPIVMVRHPRHLEVVLGGSKCSRKPYVYRFLKPGLGDGLITAKGHKWIYRRKLLTPTFHFKILENFLHVFANKSRILVQILASQVGDLGFDIHPYMAKCTLDIICETAMGYKTNSLEGEDSDYIRATYRFTHLVMERARNALYHPEAIFWLSHKGRSLRKCVDIMHSLSDTVIAKRKQQRENGQFTGVNKMRAFLDMLLEASEDGANLTDQEIREEVHTFMTAGHETTTAGLCWTVQMLGLHPEIQEKVYEEVENIFQGSNRSPTMQDLSDMKYLDRVIKETFRLYPPVPLLARVTTQDVQLDDRKVPVGTAVGISIYACHRNPEHYPDPEKFDPDRFLPEIVANRHPYAYIPFSAGPRNCIGWKFAMLEIKTVLSYLVRNYTIHSLTQHLTAVPSITLHSKQGFFCRIHKRSATRPSAESDKRNSVPV